MHLSCSKGKRCNRSQRKRSITKRYQGNKFKRMTMGPTELQDILTNKYYETVQENIGSGGQGSISILEGLDNEKYASKTIAKNSPWSHQQSYDNLRSEYHILEKLKSCPHVIQVKKLIDNGMDSKMITQLAKGGDLFVYLEKLQVDKKFMEEKTLGTFFFQLLEALACCHQRHIYHFDLKLENIVFLDKEQTKLALIDFGIAQQSDSNICYGLGGSPDYMAPEVSNQIIDKCDKVDLYGLGIVLKIMMTRTLFKTKDFKKQMETIVGHLTEPDYTLRWGWDEINRLLFE